MNSPKPGELDAAPLLNQPAGTESPTEIRSARFRQFMLDHWLICVLLVAAAVVRLIVMLAYPPAFWFGDSVTYVHAALHLHPDVIRPVGYSFLLLVLKPFHSFFVVTAVQHVMGLAIGTGIYAVLRRLLLPAWASALAAVPALFSVYALQIEHFILSDTFFGFLVTSALVLLLWRARPRIWICGVVGLILAWSAIDRTQGMLLVLPFALYLATARLGWRRFLISVITLGTTALVPVASYAWWFDQSYGTYQLTSSTGAFLYSRVAPFAQCSVVRPPRDEQWLCIKKPPSERKDPSWYVFAPGSPLSHGPGYEFSSHVNGLATDFALRTIAAQPATYLRIVWDSSVEPFVPVGDTNRTAGLYKFHLSQHALTRYELSVRKYDEGPNPRTRVIEPFASWLQIYQRFLALPGPLLGLIVATGLLGTILGWRRSGRKALLAWLVGAVLIVTPAATAAYDARYVVAAVPPFCIAAALGAGEIYRAWQRLRGVERHSPAPGAPAPLQEPAA